MANKTISELAQKTKADPSDVTIIENATTTNKIQISDLFSDTNGRLAELEKKLEELEKKLEELENYVPPVEPDPEPDPEPEPEPEPTDKFDFANNIVYGYYMGYGATVDPNNLVIDELDEDTTIFRKASVAQIGKTSICPEDVNGGECPIGGTFFVIVPATSSLNITKDNGIGGKVGFEESLLSAGASFKKGCNAVPMKLNGVDVKVWGEFMQAPAQLFFYAD